MTLPVLDSRGDRIAPGSYVRLPDGKHAWVVGLPDMTEFLTLELERGGYGYALPRNLVTVIPSGAALGRRKRARIARSHVLALATRRRGL